MQQDSKGQGLEAWDARASARKYVGLDVHKRTIAVAIADEGRAEVRSYGTIQNTPEAVAKLVKKLGPAERLACCYEAGPCGYGLQRQLVGLGASCIVVAPSLIPRRPGERIKTDRRDAVKLARLLRSGELTAVWVPDAEHEALRDLSRAREAARDARHRARQQLRSLLLRLGVAEPAGTQRWSQRYWGWLRAVELEQPLQQPDAVTDVAWRAQERLHTRYRRLAGRKGSQKAVIAVARELIGFVWALARAHADHQNPTPAGAPDTAERAA